jgi:hypothetical protein
MRDQGHTIRTQTPRWLDVGMLAAFAGTALEDVVKAIERAPFAFALAPFGLQTVPGPGDDDDDDDDDDAGGGGGGGNIEPDDDEGYDDDEDDEDDEEPLRVTARTSS